RARRASGRSRWRKARLHCAMNAVTWGTETCIPPPSPCTQCNFPPSLDRGGTGRGRSGGGPDEKRDGRSSAHGPHRRQVNGGERLRTAGGQPDRGDVGAAG